MVTLPPPIIERPSILRSNAQAQTSHSDTPALNKKKEAFRQEAIILIDSREQKPYGFPGYETSREKLNTGDYSLDGLEDRVALERKSLPDYLGSIMKGRTRFFKEVKRLAELEHSAIIIEANFEDIINESYPRSETIPRNAIIGTTQCIEVDYGVPVHWVSDRQCAQEWATWWLERVWFAIASQNSLEN